MEYKFDEVMRSVLIEMMSEVELKTHALMNELEKGLGLQ